MPTIEEHLRSYIAENILFANRYPYPDDTSFLESGVVDSMNVMEIVLHTEEAFGIVVDDHDIVPANFDSIRNIADFVRRKKGQAPAAHGTKGDPAAPVDLSRPARSAAGAGSA